MPYKNILYDRSGGVGTIRLNRPAKLNALNFEMLDEIWSLLQEILRMFRIEHLPVDARLPFFETAVHERVAGGRIL